MLSEKDFEDILGRYPELIEDGLIFSGRQVSIDGKYVDLLFEDKLGYKLIIELKKGVIKRDHIAQLLDYEGYFLSKDNPKIRVMLIGSRVPPNYQKMLDHHGLEWKEISYSTLINFLKAKNDIDFLEIIKTENDKIQLPIRVTPPKEENGRLINRNVMGPKALFEKLGAPLKNTVWSWGGVRADGAIFLRVWEDEKRKIPNEGDREFVKVAANKFFQNKPRKSPGYQERLEHLARVKNGAMCYMVICVVKDKDVYPRKIKRFNSDELYLGGKLMDYDGESWLEIVGRVPFRDVQLPSPGGG